LSLHLQDLRTITVGYPSHIACAAGEMQAGKSKCLPFRESSRLRIARHHGGQKFYTMLGEYYQSSQTTFVAVDAAITRVPHT